MGKFGSPTAIMLVSLMLGYASSVRQSRTVEESRHAVTIYNTVEAEAS
jgi:hypothetical protein